jgi:hypothetical protein
MHACFVSGAPGVPVAGSSSEPTPSAPLPIAPAAPPALAPLEAGAGLWPLAVPNYREAVVSIPTGATESAKLLDKAGIETRSVYGGGEVGHTYDGPVAEQITQALPWLVADDPRWTP